jgi:GNAT superfamily N-acetyltransferase
MTRTASILPNLPGRALSVRPIDGADAEFLYRLYASTRAEELVQTGWSDEQKHAFLLQQFMAQHQHYQQHYTGAAFDLILLDGQPAGRFYLDRWKDQYRIVDIALLPEFRGQGIGTAFLQAVVAAAAAEGVPVSIHVELFNPALRLYLRLGFRPININGAYYLLERKPEGDPMLDTLRGADFAPLLNQKFRIYPDVLLSQDADLDRSPYLEIELIEVSEWGPEAEANGGRRPFSLLFQEPNGTLLPQRIYTIAHEALGPLDLFLVPLGPKPGGMRFQVIFT